MENIKIYEVINKWFEIKLNTYDKLEHENCIYFYYEGEEYAEIRIDKKNKSIYYIWDIYKEFSEIIPLYHFEFEDFMIKWVEDTFNFKEFTIYRRYSMSSQQLIIPK